MQRYSRQKQVLGLVAWLAVSFAASAIGALASIRSASTYAELVQPNWAPSSAVWQLNPQALGS